MMSRSPAVLFEIENPAAAAAAAAAADDDDNF